MAMYSVRVKLAPRAAGDIGWHGQLHPVGLLTVGCRLVMVTIHGHFIQRDLPRYAHRLFILLDDFVELLLAPQLNLTKVRGVTKHQSQKSGKSVGGLT